MLLTMVSKAPVNDSYSYRTGQTTGLNNLNQQSIAGSGILQRRIVKNVFEFVYLITVLSLLVPPMGGRLLWTMKTMIFPTCLPGLLSLGL